MQLGAAAADVAHERPLVEDRQRLEHAEVDEAGLLDARDDLHLDAGLAAATRSRNSPWFSASRTALVATARTGASKLSAIRRQRASAATPRSIASSSRRVMSPDPVPSRTISFSRVEHVEVVVLAEPGDHEVDRVGPDVDRSESPGHDGSTVPAAEAPRAEASGGAR